MDAKNWPFFGDLVSARNWDNKTTVLGQKWCAWRSEKKVLWEFRCWRGWEKGTQAAGPLQRLITLYLKPLISLLGLNLSTLFRLVFPTTWLKSVSPLYFSYFTYHNLSLFCSFIFYPFPPHYLKFRIAQTNLPCSLGCARHKVCM